MAKQAEDIKYYFDETSYNQNMENDFYTPVNEINGLSVKDLKIQIARSLMGDAISYNQEYKAYREPKRLKEVLENAGLQAIGEIDFNSHLNAADQGFWNDRAVSYLVIHDVRKTIKDIELLFERAMTTFYPETITAIGNHRIKEVSLKVAREALQEAGYAFPNVQRTGTQVDAILDFYNKKIGKGTGFSFDKS